MAQTEQLTLENEQHWETYGGGGTCVPGGTQLIFKRC